MTSSIGLVGAALACEATEIRFVVLCGLILFENKKKEFLTLRSNRILFTALLLFLKSFERKEKHFCSLWRVCLKHYTSLHKSSFFVFVSSCSLCGE